MSRRRPGHIPSVIKRKVRGKPYYGSDRRLIMGQVGSATTLRRSYMDDLIIDVTHCNWCDKVIGGSRRRLVGHDRLMRKRR